VLIEAKIPEEHEQKKTLSMQALKLSALFEERRGKQDIAVVVMMKLP